MVSLVFSGSGFLLCSLLLINLHVMSETSVFVLNVRISFMVFLRYC